MSYIGNPIVSTDFPVDYFSGNGATVAFTLSIAPASVNSIDVQISGVSQSPQTYSVSGTTLTFSAAPPTGSSNIVVRHLGIAGIPNTPSAASVSYSSLDSSLQNRFDNSNKIINGCMRIDQRNAGASVNAANGLYTLDRWVCGGAVANKYTVQQSSVAPSGFTNSLICTSSSAYSVPSGENYGIQQSVEGFNMADLNWGTVGAKTVTLSFWVRSSLTGTFGGSLTNSAYDRSYVFSYTVSAANTWEQKFVTIAGDTSGTWLTNNGAGTRIIFSLGTGSTRVTTAGSWNSGYYASVTGEQSVVGTSGATFYITGVDLRKGSYSTAPTFNMRQYGQELALCQRYCYKVSSASSGSFMRYGNGANQSSTVSDINIFFPVTMRSLPSLTAPAASQFALYYGSGIYTCTTVALDTTSINHACFGAYVASGLGSGGCSDFMANNNTTSYLLFSAEL